MQGLEQARARAGVIILGSALLFLFGLWLCGAIIAAILHLHHDVGELLSDPARQWEHRALEEKTPCQ